MICQSQAVSQWLCTFTVWATPRLSYLVSEQQDGNWENVHGGSVFNKMSSLHHWHHMFISLCIKKSESYAWIKICYELRDTSASLVLVSVLNTGAAVMVRFILLA